MSKFMREVDARMAVEKENPRSIKEWALDILALGSLFIWAYLPVPKPLRFFTFILLVWFIIMRYQEYKDWNQNIDELTKKKLNNE